MCAKTTASWEREYTVEFCLDGNVSFSVYMFMITLSQTLVHESGKSYNGFLHLDCIIGTSILLSQV